MFGKVSGIFPYKKMNSEYQLQRAQEVRLMLASSASKFSKGIQKFLEMDRLNEIFSDLTVLLFFGP